MSSDPQESMVQQDLQQQVSNIIHRLHGKTFLDLGDDAPNMDYPREAIKAVMLLIEAEVGHQQAIILSLANSRHSGSYQFITGEKLYNAAYVSKRELEARIDEMQRLSDAESAAFRLAGTPANPSGEPVYAAEYAMERIAELKSQEAA